MNTSTKKLTQAVAVERMKEAMPQFDYSKFVYVNSVTKSTVICSVHGEFQQNYKRISKGIGCAKCGGVHKKTTEEYLMDLKAKFGEGYDKYDLSKVVYNGAARDIEIGCSKHGFFLIQAGSLLNTCTSMCPKCSIGVRSEAMKMMPEEFIPRSHLVQNHRYTYSRTVYVEMDTPSYYNVWQTW